MGSYNKAGFLSHLPIRYDDEIVAIICMVNSCEDTDYIHNPFYTDSQLKPFCLPIYGKYNDYGSLKDIEPNYTVELFEKLCGADMEDILKCIISNVSEYEPTVTLAIKHMEEYSGYENEADYQILKKLQIIDKSISCTHCNQPVVLFEHKDFFLECCNTDKKEKLLNILTFNMDVVNRYCEVLGHNPHINNIADDYLQSSLRMNAYECIIDKMSDGEAKCEQLKSIKDELKDIRPYFFNWRHMLPFYTMMNSDYKKMELDELANMGALDYYMRNIHEHLCVPGEWSQNDDMRAKKKHYQMCVKYIKKLNDKHK